MPQSSIVETESAEGTALIGSGRWRVASRKPSEELCIAPVQTRRSFAAVVMVVVVGVVGVVVVRGLLLAGGSGGGGGEGGGGEEASEVRVRSEAESV